MPAYPVFPTRPDQPPAGQYYPPPSWPPRDTADTRELWVGQVRLVPFGPERSAPRVGHRQHAPPRRSSAPFCLPRILGRQSPPRKDTDE